MSNLGPVGHIPAYSGVAAWLLLSTFWMSVVHSEMNAVVEMFTFE